MDVIEIGCESVKLLSIQKWALVNTRMSPLLQ